MKVYDYSNFSIPQLIEKIGNSRFWDLPSMLKEVLTKINISIFGDAPIDGNNYGRKDGAWEEIVAGSSGVETVTGTAVDNTDPLNPVINTPTQTKNTLAEIMTQSPFNNFISDVDNNKNTIYLTNGTPLINPTDSRYLTFSPISGITLKNSDNAPKQLIADVSKPESSTWMLPQQGGFLPIINSFIPISNTSGGVKGQIALTTTHLHICISTNVWKKIPLIDIV